MKEEYKQKGRILQIPDPCIPNTGNENMCL